MKKKRIASQRKMMLNQKESNKEENHKKDGKETTK
jgi:hypothetical protein